MMKKRPPAAKARSLNPDPRGASPSAPGMGSGFTPDVSCSELLPRLPGIHRLRGIAALFVVLAHLFQAYWLHPQIGAAIAGMASDPALVAQVQFWWLVRLPFDGGAFGVALFFLISGYVIPAAIDHHGPRRFLLGRIFRLWPTWGAALLLSLAIYYLASGGRTYETARVFANLLLARDLLDSLYITPVVWSLEVEIKYYLLATGVALLARGRTAPAIRLYCVCVVLMMAAVPLVATADLAPGVKESLFLHLASLPFILTGSALRAWQEAPPLRRWALLLVVLGLSAFVVAQVQLNDTLSQRNAQLLAYALAVPVFLLALPGLAALPRVLALPLDWLADRSYPLYAVHIVPAFALLGFVGGAVASPVLGVLSALIGVLLLAALLHALVERPAMEGYARLGRRAVRRGGG